MKILLLASHPFYQDRGTPIAVHLMLQALAARGEHVDVLTYHEGADRLYPGPGTVRIFRIPPPPACRNIRPGFSLKKLVADAALYRMAIRMARQTRYDLVHAVEESVFMALRIAHRVGTPYVYDMDSSMSQQIVDKLPAARLLLPLMRSWERKAVRGAAAVAAVCDALADQARADGAAKTVILRDVPLLGITAAPSGGAQGFRERLGISGPSLLYVGNLESYQGIDLLIESFARLPQPFSAQLVIVGGAPEHVEKYKRLAEIRDVGDLVHLIGPRPLSDMAVLMDEADVLVSPRIHGTNTPMKIFSYMASGKAILATDLFTHTQVLDQETAALAAPTPPAFAAAMATLIADPEQRQRLGAAAQRAVQTKYSLDVFQRTLNELYDGLTPILP
jgi:glycosyltransferase involved in cell wall biosynthesis